MGIYDVVETFTSINGEGPKAGQLAFFVRFKGCNLNCNYCDTCWANEADAPAVKLSSREIYQMVLDSGIKNVTLTGGEPLYRADMLELLNLLCQDKNLDIEIETNGSIDLTDFAGIMHAPAFTMDYKMPDSGMESAMYLPNFHLLTQKDTVKFVVSSVSDCEKALEIINEQQLIGRCHVYLSPVFGRIEPAEIVDFMIQQCMNGVHLQLQMHKFIWDPNQRGV